MIEWKILAWVWHVVSRYFRKEDSWHEDGFNACVSHYYYLGIMDSQIMIVEYSWCCNVFVYALMPGIKSRFVRHSAKNLEATPWWISSPKISIFFRILLGERRAKSSSYSKDWRGQPSGSHILLICLICLCKD